VYPVLRAAEPGGAAAARSAASCPLCRLAYSRRMRAHGEPKFPDPRLGGRRVPAPAAQPL